ncbi:MAG: hypothetical protein K0R57_2942 [Paenibacillaceae bacterium]|nr:hypothetical protein [Paenibacillaceae bacterium]
MEAIMKEMLGVLKELNVRIGSLEEGQLSLKNEVNSLKEDVNSLKDEMASFRGELNSLKEDVNSLKEDVNSLKDEQRSFKAELLRLGEEQRAGFQSVNERLDRVEHKLDLTFNQVGASAEDLTELRAVVSIRFEAHRNIIARTEEDVELLKMRMQA